MFYFFFASGEKAAPVSRSGLYQSVSRSSDIVAERALDLATELLGLALGFLCGTVCLRIRIVAFLLRLADGLVDVAFDLVDEFAHGFNPFGIR